MNTDYSFVKTADFFGIVLPHLIDPRPLLIAIGLPIVLDVPSCLKNTTSLYSRYIREHCLKGDATIFSKQYYADIEMFGKFYNDFLNPRLAKISNSNIMEEEEAAMWHSIKANNQIPPLEIKCPFYGPNYKDTTPMPFCKDTNAMITFFMCIGKISFENYKETKISEVSKLVISHNRYSKEYEKGKNYSTKRKLREGWVWQVKK